MPGKMLSTPEVAERLGVSRTTAHRYLTQGKIQATKTPGGDFRVDENVLELFITRGHTPSPNGPRIIAVVNQKGGVGKTTTSVNLAAELNGMGEPVLLIDADPQANATMHFGIQPYELTETLYNVMHSGRGVETAIHQIRPGLDVLPASLDLSAVEWELVTSFGRERILKKALKPVLTRYSYIIIDCPPTLGMLTMNALMVANEVLIPLQVEPFAVNGLAQLQNTIELVQSDNPDLQISGVLCTMYDSRNALSPAITKKIRDQFGDLVYRSVIPRNVALSVASGAGKPVATNDPGSSGALAYAELAKEVASRGEN